MASSRDRQRKLARAKLDRQMARRAAKLRRRRQIRAGVGAALALLLIVAGSAWLLGAFDRGDTDLDAAEPEQLCSWTPQSADDNENLKDVGTPPTDNIPDDGIRPMTITTNQGAPITAELDLAAAPCAAASFAHLAEQNFFADTTCHAITENGALHCGDPSGTGLGGPTYSFFDENKPAPEPSEAAGAEQPPAYPKGTIALVGAPAGNNGSQFLLFFADYAPEDPIYPVVGRVTGGLDVLEKIGALPTVENDSGEQTKPEQDVVIQSLTVGEPTDAAPAETADPSAPPANGDPSATPSAS